MDNIKEKIQKLLNMASDETGNEHEMNIALKKATELMNKWNLDINTVMGQSLEVQVYKFDFYRWTSELYYLTGLLMQLSDTCGFYQNGSKKYNNFAALHISGRTRDIENFIYLFEFIRKTLNKESNKYKLSIRKSGTDKRNHIETKSFRFGFIDVMARKLNENKSAFFTVHQALVCINSEVKIKEAKEFLHKDMANKGNELIEVTNKSVKVSTTALDAGTKVAEDIDLNVAVNGKKTSKLEYKN